ncbi:MAG: Cyclic nucleotide-binding:Bacterial regulatory protein Crp [Proteobacteria bacterium]|nr:Cyclic nucleotide-binding:Bacterial regulatory protein Crp [Pseudomonadota bacterium]
MTSVAPGVTRSLSLLVLHGVPLLSGLDRDELEKLSHVTGRRRAERGEFIVRAGDVADSLFILFSGSAKVLNSDDEGREVILAVLKAGEFFGEMGLIDGSPRSASVVAQETCELLVISRDDLHRCMQDNFQVALKLMQILVHRLRGADEKIESLALLDVYGRVARLMLDMSELADDGRRIIKRKISKQEMARMIGASREMVSKVVRNLENSGYIHYEGDVIVILGE